jgi:hypothetical protein
MVSTGWACRAGLAAHQTSVRFGSANRRLLSGGAGRGGGGKGGGVGSDVHKNKKLLNKPILSIANMQGLCDLINASSTQFNHVNVATAFRKVLQISRSGVLQDSVAKALQTLEDTALHTMKTFGSQGIANTLQVGSLWTNTSFAMDKSLCLSIPMSGRYAPLP